MSEPASLTEISDAICSHDRVAVRGARTKPRLSAAGHEAHLLSMTAYTGVLEYEPSEYTITVKAGTRVAEVVESLAAKGQYLPFDPLWVGTGATIGGTVAANAAGPGRVRYGGVRDFIIGATFVDGRGQVLRTGGKVVKNAAGFDLPKFIVGSMGRWGVIAEITFKVFPRPAKSVTRQWTCKNHADAAQRIAEVARSRWEPTAIEYLPAERQLWVRLSGPAAALNKLTTEVDGESGPDDDAWRDHNEFRWAPRERNLVRVPITLREFPSLVAELETLPVTMAVSGAGNTLWISSAEGTDIDRILNQRGLRGLNFHGTTEPLWWGKTSTQKIDRALQAVFDPDHRFDAFI